MNATSSKEKPAVDVDGLRVRFAAYMKRKGLCSTTQRRLVTDTFFTAGGHSSIEDLVGRVRALDPRIGYATVYRTLKLLADSGLARAADFGDGRTRYEVARPHEHHDHMICEQCGTITEFEDERIERLQREIAGEHGFRLRRHKLELYGVCRGCAKAATRDDV